MAEDSLFSDDGQDEDQLFSSSRHEIDASEYRSLSAWAVGSLVLSLISLAFFILLGPDGVFLYGPMQLAGILIGVAGLLKIRNNSFELTGEKVARIGLTLNTAVLLIGATWATITLEASAASASRAARLAWRGRRSSRSHTRPVASHMRHLRGRSLPRKQIQRAASANPAPNL